ncbi:MAG: ABC transporter permease [Candidatus Omnitrophica bacterium]|nr:ABC transporter permease [Candidatus Omnitrophota bacterium]
MRNNKPVSRWGLVWRNFSRKRWVLVCFIILVGLYAGALFADFLSPYAFDNENRNMSYAPPTKIRFMADKGYITWPYVCPVSFTFDELHKRIYVEDRAHPAPLQIFFSGEEYNFLGVFKSKTHLFGVKEPARIYLFGADSRGRDLFSRLFYGGRISLTIGLIGVAISFALGLLVGGTAGYYGGKIDSVLMRICEMFMLVPGFYLMLALRSAVPDNFNSYQIYFSIVIILSLIGWAGLARIIRGMSISLRERDYVLAAKTMGLTDWQIITRHILPHTVSYSIVAVTLSIPGYILGEAALSLIGLGIQDPLPSWGNMLSDAMAIAHVQLHPWILIPGVYIFVTVMCFNVVGNRLRDCFDPLNK